jgi:hypothetical protein
MQKKRSAKRESLLALHKETLRLLGISDLQGVAGGAGRIRIPIGFEDDTTPIYADMADTGTP